MVVGALYVKLVAPGMFAHDPLLDCHWIVMADDPPLIVAVNNAVPPIHTSLVNGATDTVASGCTMTVATFETGSSQPEAGSVITIR